MTHVVDFVSLGVIVSKAEQNDGQRTFYITL